jgi:hypothetical protein
VIQKGPAGLNSVLSNMRVPEGPQSVQDTGTSSSRPSELERERTAARSATTLMIIVHLNGYPAPFSYVR